MAGSQCWATALAVPDVLVLVAHREHHPQDHLAVH